MTCVSAPDPDDAHPWPTSPEPDQRGPLARLRAALRARLAD